MFFDAVRINVVSCVLRQTRKIIEMLVINMCVATFILQINIQFGLKLLISYIKYKHFQNKFKLMVCFEGGIHFFCFFFYKPNLSFVNIFVRVLYLFKRWDCVISIYKIAHLIKSYIFSIYEIIFTRIKRSVNTYCFVMKFQTHNNLILFIIRLKKFKIRKYQCYMSSREIMLVDRKF